MGTKPVTPMWTASLIHQQIIKAATAAVLWASGLMPAGAGSSSTAAKPTIPATKPSVWRCNPSMLTRLRSGLDPRKPSSNRRGRAGRLGEMVALRGFEPRFEP